MGEEIHNLTTKNPGVNLTPPSLWFLQKSIFSRKPKALDFCEF